MIFQFFFFNKSAKMSTILFFLSIWGAVCTLRKKMNLNDITKSENLRGSEYFL